MADSAQQLFALWKKQFDDGAEAWGRLMTQLPSAAPDALWWKPMFDQWAAAWARVFAQAPVGPEVIGQWKQFIDQSIEAWSRAFGQAMSTDAFAQALGRSLDQILAAQSPARKAADHSTESALQAFNVPSRAQVTNVAKQIIALEERLERLEDGLADLQRLLREVAHAVQGTGPARAPGERVAP
jgi:hypothetical protein